MTPIFYNTRQKLERLITNSSKNPKYKRKGLKRFINITFASFSLIVLYFSKFKPSIVLFLFFLAFVLNIIIQYFDDVTTLKEALKYFKKDKDIKAYRLLDAVYQRTNASQVLEIILEYFKEKGEPEEGEKIIIFKEWGLYSKKNKKLDKIYININKTIGYIKSCRQNIKKFKNKEIELEKLLLNEENENLRQGYVNAISSYKEMQGLETSKLKFYENSKNELYKIKDYHIGQIKLSELTNELEQAKQEYFKNSFVEKNITAEDIYNSIENEKSYIEALDYYSESILNSSNIKMFEELQKEFDDKTKKIR